MQKKAEVATQQVHFPQLSPQDHKVSCEFNCRNCRNITVLGVMIECDTSYSPGSQQTETSTNMKGTLESLTT